MRLLVQRVLSAAVHVGDEEVGAIACGLLLFVGATHDDTLAEAQAMAAIGTSPWTWVVGSAKLTSVSSNGEALPGLAPASHAIGRLHQPRRSRATPAHRRTA